ncbi:hypothetical protein [Devosia sp. FJ2-5-3]|uniref:hypothetical protein n=1 Tax=Devosia sp. FJ2-5-3 TaxID=2976680 RepID=UPI0023D8311C|nr:hypothetical protein [Devosia sp. FJ2-5-3]WEJ60189.1 hypothetical protein N0P34_09205 [Devosia sp. FJ2-5-3]
MTTDSSMSASENGHTGGYTPGPWKRGSCDSWIIWAPAYASTDWKRDQDGGPESVVVATLDVPAWATVPCDGETRDAWLAEADATANLIAAAPKLKDALAAMLDFWGGYECPEVDAAIAVMQELGEDRWSMQAQMDSAKAEGGAA